MFKMFKRAPALCALAIAIAVAQEGHPLTGTWSGEWSAPGAMPVHLTLVIAWKGNTISGVLNPGPDSVDVSGIHLGVTEWTVGFETDLKDKTHVTAEGKIEDLASAHRRMVGTWRQGSQQGTFRLTRD